ncbi:ATP-binding protein [Paucibacter sp. Y2R2-4]|uniref:ATP-binding protein n=1 Tax=Paucibacter sp. Y2R2-4 TaxID=2893553 RepID=UPI0021E3CD88|nr:ATP-binding protein [Paucibacter sp. Y2R2-4]MCV2348836.1 response regulator [Paucibacter sp. Y2R2-4]
MNTAEPVAARVGEDTGPDIAEQVRSEQLASLYERTLTPTSVGALFSLFPVILLWPHLPHSLLLSWLGVRLLISLTRCVDLLRFRRFWASKPSHAQVEPWRTRFLALLAVDSLTWGLMGWFFHAPEFPQLEGLMLAAMVGLGAIGMFSLGGRLRANLLFSVLALGPLAAYHLCQGSQQGALTGLSLMLFIVVALKESRKIDSRTTELLRLRFATDWLAQQRQQALQSAEHSSSSKSRFVAVMSHEIRTPLNGILGMTQLLERTQLDAQQREQVDIMRRSGQHLLALVNDILDLARIESGKLAVDAGPVNVRETVDDVCRLLGETARDKGLDFALSLSPALPRYALGDASRIKQVLHNLIGNAIKFTERGQVSVEVSPTLDMRAGTLLRFAVRDTGEGIAADQMERVFAPFEQAEAMGQERRPRRQDGTGLGLTISRELARAMGGDLRCSSVPGQGSLFEFTLPLQACADMGVSRASRPEAQAPMRHATANVEPDVPFEALELMPPTSAAKPEPSAAPAKPPRLSGRVLLVDDSMVNVLVASSMLESCGLQVDQAENGVEALERLETLAYDLVLMDCQMPKMDGFEATRRWRALERSRFQGHVPIVALTASAVNGDRERCIQCGMDDYLVKPFEMDDLVAVVQRHLQVAELA